MWNSAQIFSLISLLLLTAVAFRLLTSKLYRSYPYFSGFIAVAIVRGSISLFPLPKNLYAEFFMITEVLIWIFYVLILMELYSLVLARYQGIQSLGKWIFHGSVAVSLLIAMATLYPKLGSNGKDMLMLFFVGERGILSALALLTLLMTAFLTWFPVPLPRNVILHSIVFASYFFSKAAVLLVRNIAGHKVASGTSLTLFVIGWICMALWAIFLTPEGEHVEARVRRTWNEDEEDRLLDQLKSINATLSRSAQ